MLRRYYIKVVSRVKVRSLGGGYTRVEKEPEKISKIVNSAASGLGLEFKEEEVACLGSMYLNLYHKGEKVLGMKIKSKSKEDIVKILLDEWIRN